MNCGHWFLSRAKARRGGELMRSRRGRLGLRARCGEVLCIRQSRLNPKRLEQFEIRAGGPDNHVEPARLDHTPTRAIDQRQRCAQLAGGGYEAYLVPHPVHHIRLLQAAQLARRPIGWRQKESFRKSLMAHSRALEGPAPPRPSLRAGRIEPDTEGPQPHGVRLLFVNSGRTGQ